MKIIFQAFEKSEIVPDVIDEAPHDFLTVMFAKTGKIVDLGNELMPKDLKDEPLVIYGTNSNKFYTLLMLDPDGFSREEPTLRNVLHWMIVNVPGSSAAVKINSAPNSKVAYIPSGPPKDSGLHRYVFLLYAHEKVIDYSDIEDIPAEEIEKRFNFNVKSFEKKYGLDSPTAGNFYECQWDETVSTK